MKTAEQILDEHCGTYYNRNTGEEEIESSKSSVIIAMEEFAKQYSDKKDDEFKFGDIVRAKCTAIGRYIGDNKCVYISAMTSDRIVSEVHRTGSHDNDYDRPVVSDEELQKYRKY